MKRTSKRSLLWVRCCAHGWRDTFQIVIKDCPKTTHAFTAILRSWHVSVFAQFQSPPTDLWSHSQYYISVAWMPVKMLYSCLLVYADLALRDLPRSLLVPKDMSRCRIKTCSTKWKERDYSSERFNQSVVDGVLVII